MQPSVNQYFSLPRFARLFGRHTAEHLRGYLLTAAVGLGGMVLVMGFVTYLSHRALDSALQNVFFILFLLGGGALFASTVFAPFGERRRATVALLLPASHLEKFLVAWLYSLPLFLVVFVPLFYLADAAVAYAGAAPGQTPELVNILADRQAAWGVLGFLLMLHAAWLAGGIYFEKTHFVKTGFAVFLLLAAVSAVNFQVLKAWTGAHLQPSPPFTTVVISEGTTYYMVGLPEGHGAWLGLVPVALAGLLWLAAYCRLTEKQI